MKDFHIKRVLNFDLLIIIAAAIILHEDENPEFMLIFCSIMTQFRFNLYFFYK